MAKAKVKEKQIPDKFLEAAMKYTLDNDGKIDLIEFLDEVDHLSSLVCTQEGGFRVPSIQKGKQAEGNTHLNWEEEVVKILKSIGFVLASSWSGEVDKPNDRCIEARANGKTLMFCY